LDIGRPLRLSRRSSNRRFRQLAVSSYFGGGARRANGAGGPRRKLRRAKSDSPPSRLIPDAGGRGWLVASGLAKAYRGRPVVHDASLAVARGEAVGLLGPNGAGKTTIFYMITGLVKADR